MFDVHIFKLFDIKEFTMHILHIIAIISMMMEKSVIQFTFFYIIEATPFRSLFPTAEKVIIFIAIAIPSGNWVNPYNTT